MLRSWLKSHRSLVATATSGVLIAAIVATIAIVSTGYTAQKMQLDDGSVWVANGNRQAVRSFHVNQVAALERRMGARPRVDQDLA